MSRFTISALVLCTSAGLASAAPAPPTGLAPLPTSLPPRCQPLAHVPASATIPGPTIAAHVSVANCLAEDAMNALSLSPSAASIAQLNAAVAPSLALLDGVIRTGDPYWELVAQDAKRDLYSSMIVRVRRTLPADDASARASLEPRLTAWQASESRAETAMADLGRAHPDLARRDAVVAGIARRIPDQRKPQMATRSR